MKSSMVFLLVCAVAMAWAAPVLSQPRYVLLEPGNEKWYEDADAPEYTLHVYPDGMEGDWTLMRYTLYLNGMELQNLRERLLVDENGSVWSMGFLEATAQPTTPVLFVEAPLYVGRTWTTETYYEGYGTIVRFFTCIEEAEITVPFGTYNCFHVEWENHEPDGSVSVRHRWYCDGTGRIKMDTYEMKFANVVVATEERTWSAVKRLFR